MPHTKDRVRFLTEPYVIVPVFALLMVAVTWAVAMGFIAKERENARLTAIDITQRLVETYEAQVLRALNEIGQNFKMFEYGLRSNAEGTLLASLREQELLLPRNVFKTRLLTRDGKILDSTAAASAPVDPHLLEALQGGQRTWVGPPIPQKAGDEPEFEIAQAIGGTGKNFTHIVSVSMSAGYLVSDYDEQRFGREGVLAILGTDGVFRAVRVGEHVTAGGRVDYDEVAVGASGEGPARLARSPWDSVNRYTAARKLFEFPLTVVVALPETERMAVADEAIAVVYRRASVITVLILIGGLIVTWLTFRVATLRARAVEIQMQHAEAVEYLAFHDGLTTLPNRSFFQRTLQQQLSAASRKQRPLALLFLDLDGFKKVNDVQGHQAGDELLKQVALRLKGCVRAADVVARLGGDEFVVLLPEVGDGASISIVAQHIIAAVAKPYLLMEHESRVTVSVGICVYPDDGEDEDSLTKNADAAMYRAKELGKNNFQFYSAALGASSLERRAMEASLRRALVQNEFQLVFHAIRDTSTRAITGAEALLRWNHPELGVVMPMTFLPIAEEAGLIATIGKWILRAACQQNMAWQAQGSPPLRIGVNLSTRQFLDRDLIHDVQAALTESGMAPHLLELEVSETTLMQHMKKSLAVLNALREIGVRTAIDDFGFGYSSLSMLRNMPVDALKIDRAFVRTLNDSDADRDVVHAIIAMGRSLNLPVVAQGVERQEQLNELQNQHCDEVQGFFVSSPLPSDQFMALLMPLEHPAE